MGCLPESGGCERQRTDLFVGYLNELECTHFTHDTCLDQVFRNSPQPEVLYVDADTGTRLVIERKTLVWPLDYVVRHKNDHFVADLLSKGLLDLTSNAPYQIELEVGLVGQHNDLAEFANQIITAVRENFSEVERGRIIRSTKLGRRWRFFRENSSRFRTDGDPEKGLMVLWNLDEPFHPNPPNELLKEVPRLFECCVLKFQAYLNARRILLVDPQGELQHKLHRWCAQIFEMLPPPPEISEIWTGTSYESITDWEQDWIFERLYPTSTPQEGAV